MSGIDNFTELKCWQEARTLVNSIYSTTKDISFKREYDLVRQLRRAAVSGMTNIAEGFARFNRKEFYNFLNIAQASIAEVVSLLYICLDQNMVSQKEFSTISTKCELTRKSILNLMKYLSSSKAEQLNKAYSIKESLVDYNNYKIPENYKAD